MLTGDVQLGNREFPIARFPLYSPSHRHPATIVSRRAYLQDAAFLVALTGPQPLLHTIADALRAPRWPVFLGRKSCIPTRPVLECLTEEYRSIKEALTQHPWSCQSMELLGEPPEPQLFCTIDDPDGPTERTDRIRINPARNYARRRVRTFPTPTPSKES